MHSIYILNSIRKYQRELKQAIDTDEGWVAIDEAMYAFIKKIDELATRIEKDEIK